MTDQISRAPIHYMSFTVPPNQISLCYKTLWEVWAKPRVYVMRLPHTHQGCFGGTLKARGIQKWEMNMVKRIGLVKYNEKIEFFEI